MNYLAFKSFLASSGLSTRRFGDLCGIGKSTVHRLAQPRNGGLTAPYVRRITPAVMDACRLHLERAGAGAAEVHRHLTGIFGDDFKPMINHRSVLTPDILAFFNLKRDPFAAPRSPAELFTTPAIESVYAQLHEAVRFQGFVCVLAPVGAGKTVLKNRLIAALGPRSGCTSPHVSKGELVDTPNEIQNPKSKIQNRSSVIISPSFPDMSRLTAAGIVACVLEELGVKPRRALVLARKQLEQRLAELAENNISVALCFDECHHLNDTLLTALKNFYELGTGGFERYLGLVLFGQPQFAERLELPRFREIAERLACLHLPAFSAETAENYLTHCLNNAHLDTPHESPKSQVPNVPGSCSHIGPSGLGPGTWDLGPTSISDLGFGISDLGGEEGLGSKIKDPRSEPGAAAIGSPSNPKSEVPHPKLFTPEAVRLILARASTPLGLANAAAAAMIEAYKKGERRVLARFVGEETGPKTVRV